MQPDAFHLMILFGATCGVLFLPVIFGLAAVLLEKPQ